MTRTLMVDWKSLKQSGWPMCRAHTWRLMEPTIQRSRGSAKKGNLVTWVEPNPDPFPRCKKLGAWPNSPVVWDVAELATYFKAHGLNVPDNWNAP